MRRNEAPADFLAGIAFRALTGKPQIIAPLHSVSDEMNKRLQQTNRLTGKVVGGHPCIIVTPK